MNLLRPMRLTSVFVCLCGLAILIPARAQNPPAPPPPNGNNPFENIPRPNDPQPRQQGPVASANIIEFIQIRGARRVPQDTLRTMIVSRVGDAYNEETLRRDFATLWNTRRFDDIRLETEKGERGGIVVTFLVTEWRERK